ncbi:MAG: hypothetical protein M8835_01495 [marine benthic group bacterium]|nr:hypothetical protein [Gemmatimonadota bacterium]
MNGVYSWRGIPVRKWRNATTDGIAGWQIASGMTALLAILSLVITSTPSSAQQGGPGGRRMSSPRDRLAQLTEQLDLSDAQVDQMRPIIEEQTKKQQKIFEEGSGDREKMRGEMMKLMQETDERYAEILTEEQMTRYREMRQQRMRQGRPPPKPR